MPQSVCLTTRGAARAVAVDGEVEGERAGRRRAASARPRRAARRRRPRTRGRAERDRPAASAPRRRSSARCSPCRRRRAPACRRCPRCTRSEAASAVSCDARLVADLERRLPRGDVRCTSRARPWPRRRCARCARRASRRRVRAGTYLAESTPRGSRTSNVEETTDGSRAGPPVHDGRSRSTRASRRSPTWSASCRASRAAACSRRPGRTPSRPRSRSRWARCR